MEQFNISHEDSLKSASSNGLLNAQRSFVRFFELRSRYVENSYGKESGTNNKCWHTVLVDCDKIDQFFKEIKTGSIDVADYGRIISSGFGDIPKEVSLSNISISDLVSNDFLLVTLHLEGNDKFFYVLSQSGKKRDVREARTVEEIEIHGTILYVADFVEPPECVAYEFLRGLFRMKRQIENIASRHSEVTEEIRDINCLDENGTTILHLTSYCGKVCIVRRLVDLGADIHVRDELCERLPMHLAAMQGHIDVIQFYLDNGISVNETDGNGWTPLHFALWKGHKQSVMFLIRNGCQMNVKDKCLGKTPLHVGAEEGHTEVVKVLLENGAPIDDLDDYGRTPLYYSAMADCLETAKFLIGRGANIHIANKSGWKPLHVSVSCGNKEMAECLIIEGSNIDNQTNYGETPLHLAASEGFLVIVQLLIDKGANINNVNQCKETPFECGKNHNDVAFYLGIKMIDVFLTQGNLEDALKVYKVFSKIQLDYMGLDKIKTIDIIGNLAKMLYEQGKYGKALDILKDIDAKGFRSNDYDVMRTKCEQQLSYCDAQDKYKAILRPMESLYTKFKQSFSGVFEKLSADQHDPLNAACDVASGHFGKCEYDQTINTLDDELEQSTVSAAVVQSDLQENC